MTDHKHWQQHLGTLADILRRTPFALITDIDGTISPIAPTPEEAIVSPAARESLSMLQQRIALVAAVTGRSAAYAHKMLALPGVVVVGNHGLERWRDGQAVLVDEAAPFLDAIESALQAAKPLVERFGMDLEPKGSSASLHYRNAPDRDAVRDQVFPQLAQIAQAHGLRLFEGRYIFELHPPLEVNKGTAIEALAEEFGIKGLFFMGDDITDLNAFRALHAMRQAGRLHGLALGVLSDEAPPGVAQEADLTLGGVADVERFLGWMLDNVG